MSPACPSSGPCSPGSPLPHPYPRSPPTSLEPVAKNNVANKRLRKSAEREGHKKAAPSSWTTPNGVHPATAAAAATTAASWDTSIPSGNSAFESVRRAVQVTSMTSPRLTKVKTTQQLIADLEAKSGATVSLDGVVVPPRSPAATAVTSTTRKGARGRRGGLATTSSASSKRSGNYSLLGTDDETSRTKSELMDRFLQSSSSAAVAAAPHNNGPVSQEIAGILSALPDLASFENLDEEEVGDSGEDVPRVPMEVTPEVEERFVNERWEHVNGLYDASRQWKGWEEVTTGESVGGDILHILPYVNIDW